MKLDILRVNCCYITTILLISAFNGCLGRIPAKVVGIFRTNTCAPALAAALAVENYNILRGEPYFQYENIPKSEREDLTSNDLIDLDNKIIVTGYMSHCEQLSKLLGNHPNSFLICYSFSQPMEITLDILESTNNLYMSQPNPKALVPCFFKLINFLVDITNSPCTSVHMLLDRKHPYHQLWSALFSNLSYTNYKVNISWLEDVKNQTLSSQLHNKSAFALQIMIVVLHELEARRLLCELYNRKLFGSNFILIVAGITHTGTFRKNWLNKKSPYDQDMGESEGFCKQEQLLAAAEGHFFLELPSWNVGIDKSKDLKRIRATLEGELRDHQEHIMYDYDEAPLAYDSVWAMTQAISQSACADDEIPEKCGNLSIIVKQKLTDSFTGLSGEFSLNESKLRSVNKATVIINRFVNDSRMYIPFGRHFNANSSFQWLHYPILDDISNSIRESTHPECELGTTTESPSSTLNHKSNLRLSGLLLLTPMLILSTLFLCPY